MKTLNLGGLAFLFLLILPTISLRSGATPPAEETIQVDAAKVVRSFAQHPLGININHLTDEDSKRPEGSRPLVAALKELGVRSLRFPEGELGDSYLWALPPFPAKSAARAQWALRGPGRWPSSDPRFSTSDFQALPNIMDFDTFLDVAKETKAAPVLIVAYDSAYKKLGADETGPTVAELIASAAAWVRYANITKRRDIRYWEIGNETDIQPEAHAGTDPGARQQATDFLAFARAMKAEDPTIKVGLNVFKNNRLRELLAFPDLWPQVDFISLHNYPTYGWKEGYDTFRKSTPSLIDTIEEAEEMLQQSSLSSSDKTRIEFLVTETNIIDWAKENKWSNLADHGHALVLFDLIGQTLSQPRVTLLHQWITRWIDSTPAGKPLPVYDALTPDNQLTPVGQVLGLWSRSIGSQLVSTRSTGQVLAYATASPEQRRLVVFLLNKDTRAHGIALELKNLAHPTLESIQCFSAPNPEAQDSKLEAVSISDVALENIQLPPLSVTVLTFTNPP